LLKRARKLRRGVRTSHNKTVTPDVRDYLRRVARMARAQARDRAEAEGVFTADQVLDKAKLPLPPMETDLLAHLSRQFHADVST
jgi:hypothetical protein